MLSHLLDKATPWAEDDTPDWHGYVYTVGIFFGAVFGAFAYYHAGFTGWTLAAKIRAVMVMMTFKKTLKVQNSAQRNSGQIVNMVSSDAQILTDTFAFFMTGLVAPIQLIVVTGLLWKEIGPFALIPLGTFIVSMPITGIVSSKFGGLRFKQQQASDQRLKLIRELISAVRIVKYYAWEVPFQRNIDDFREYEIERVRKTAMTRTIAVGVFSAVGPIGTALTYTFYSLGGSFDLSRIFTALALLNLVRLPLQILPLVLVFGSQYMIAFNRVRDFCILPELPKRDARPPSKVAIRMKNTNLSWEKDTPVLSKLNIKVKQGECVMVVGSVGSGKSSLAQAVIGEMPIIDGEIEVNGGIAYVPQEAWIINASVRENIIFGNHYDEALYNKVIKMAALVPDFAIMPAGDKTEIGDRGINLSGGQRQRVSIARALYANRDVYVFDDPFSAVDSHVAKHLIENAVVKYIRGQGKTGFIVTNQLQFLSYADRVIMLKGGRIVEQGKFEDLMANGREFAALIKEFGVFEKDEDGEESSSEASRKAPVKKPTQDANAEKKEEGSGALTGSEERESGSIDAAVYWYYIKSGGLGLFFLSVFLLFSVVAARVFYALWLSDWSASSTGSGTAPPAVGAAIGCRAGFNFTANPGVDPNTVCPPLFPLTPIAANQANLFKGGYTRDQWLGGYLGASFFEVIFFFLHMIPLVYWSRNASRTLHKNLLTKVLRASTTFFDATPAGRLIARFSKDINLIDDLLAFQFDQYIGLLLTLVGIFAQMAASQPFILIIMGVAFIVFYFMQRIFQRTAIDIQRLEALSRAPIFSHLSETIEGASSIRAYGMQKKFVRANMNKVDTNLIDYLGLRYSTAWFGMRLDWLGTAIIVTTFLAIFLTRNYSTLNFALAALAMSSTTNITFALSAVANNSVELETKMNSVERIRQYLSIQQEAPAHIEDTKPDESWPAKGNVTFKGLSIAYKAGDPVLKKISAKIHAREKIGIVGRTGAGKSTLVTALFRMVEPSEGTIEIDGVDIMKLGLTDLRRKLSIIPQMPQLFIGTVRYNVDPFKEKEDKDIWRALEMVQLKSYIDSLPDKLESKVEENGSNFSVGQRQLLAMARALLVDAKILLLDEATAAVDNETDSLIQAMVRKNFKEKTVLTIAHRLNTIMDYDRIMVLDKGKLVEFDSPKNLLDDKTTIFYSMVEATGEASAEHLRRIARGEVTVVEALTPSTDRKKKDSSKDSKKAKSSSSKNVREKADEDEDDKPKSSKSPKSKDSKKPRDKKK
jgi:ABC-type multidrug transport system fused ATPase/permease subunit